MILIMGKFVEFLRLVIRNLKVDGLNGNLLKYILMLNPRKKITIINWGGMIFYRILQKGINIHVYFYQQKKWY